MIERLKKILAKVDADYADVRYEEKKDTSVVFSGDELTTLKTASTDGYVVRVLKSGGFSTISFTSDKDAEEAVKKVVENAGLIAANIKEPVRFEKVEAVKDRFVPELSEDPREISIDEKVELTRRYNSIPLGNKSITSTRIGYGEVIRDKYFVSSEGSEINEMTFTTRVSGEIMARDGNVLQNVRVAVGGSDGFNSLRNQDIHFENKTAIAVELLSAQSVKAGTYNVVLNPSLAGVFTHEAFGHFSEADLIEDSPTMREKMQIGSKLGNDVLSIIDDPTSPGQLGFYRYDDEGVPVRPTSLMKNGVLTGRLHSRRTAAAFGEPVSGHCVAEDYRFSPIIRMGTIYIEPGQKSLEELMQLVGNGLYLLDAKGGQTSGENFTFGAQYGYLIKDGKKAEMVRDINISGNLYKTLMNITAIGNDLSLCKAGGCGKGQTNIKSCHGAPHVVANNVILGGV